MKHIQLTLIVFISLCSLSLFELRGISSPVANSLQLLGVLLIFTTIAIYMVYYRGALFAGPMHFTMPLIIMTLCVVSSVIYAAYRFDQSIHISIYQSRSFFFFFIYFVLHIFMPKGEDIEKIILSIGLTAALIFLIQTVVYPVRIIESKIFYDRNTLRIFMKGEQFRIMGYLIVVNRFMLYKKTINILYLLIFLAVAVLIGSRSTLAFHLFIPLLILLTRKQINNRFLLLLVISAMVVSLLAIFWNIIESMLTVSQLHAAQGNQYGRFRAIRFFINDFMTPVSFFTGNSVAHGTSEYGRLLYNLSMYKGYYLSDIGLVGTLVIYGIIYVSVSLFLMFKTVFRQLPNHLMYIRHYFILLFLVSIFSYSIFDGGQGAIILSFLFFIIDRYEYAANKIPGKHPSNKIILP